MTVTNPNMTRFYDEFGKLLIWYCLPLYMHNQGDMVQKAPACTIGILAQALQELFGVKK